jgi:hypothetical protein
METKIIPISEAPKREEPYEILPKDAKKSPFSRLIEYPKGWMIRHKEYSTETPEPMILKPTPVPYNGEIVENEPSIIH